MHDLAAEKVGGAAPVGDLFMSLGLRTFEWSLHCITKELELQVREVAVPARLQTLERGFSPHCPLVVGFDLAPHSQLNDNKSIFCYFQLQLHNWQT